MESAELCKTTELHSAVDVCISAIVVAQTLLPNE